MLAVRIETKKGKPMLQTILDIPDRDRDLQCGIVNKTRAKLVAPFMKKGMIKGDRVMSEDIKIKVKSKGKLPTGSMTRSD